MEEDILVGEPLVCHTQRLKELGITLPNKPSVAYISLAFISYIEIHRMDNFLSIY